METAATTGFGEDSRSRLFADTAARAGASGPAISIGSLELGSPVMPASGCFGPELGGLVPVGELGATVTKTVFATMRAGNAAPRVSELPSGMVNSVGIPSLGPEGYLRDLHPRYEALGIPTIISVGGHRVREFADVVERLQDAGDAYELNVSCPNLDASGIEIGADPAAIGRAVTLVRQVTERPVIVKLAPMVASIADCALAAEIAGADAVCVANSVPVLAVNPRTLTPVLGNFIGGLTGPSIRPINLRLVWQCTQHLKIPVIGCGGVLTLNDALEYFAVGAAAIQVGTATLGVPASMIQIARDLNDLYNSVQATSMGDLLEKARERI